MPFRYSQTAVDNLAPNDRMIEDLRDTPIPGRNTKFRLLQQNILAYTFENVVPGWATSGINGMRFKDVVDQCIENAQSEGKATFGVDFQLNSNAVAKVTGDIYEVVTSAVLWNMAACWNEYMATGVWSASRRYRKPQVKPNLEHQVAVLNLPRRYDWVRLLDAENLAKISSLRGQVASLGLSIPTSTPDIAIVELPASKLSDPVWQTSLADLGHRSQAVLREAHLTVEDSLSAGDIILAIALKSSLRSDRLYQPLYEANVMQLLLEGHLGAERVDFEVHALTAEGTGAEKIYQAASLHSINSPDAHRAVRELYQPQNAGEMAARFLSFLEQKYG